LDEEEEDDDDTADDFFGAEVDVDEDDSGLLGRVFS
jgi:hypothetical protein